MIGSLLWLDNEDDKGKAQGQPIFLLFQLFIGMKLMLGFNKKIIIIVSVLFILFQFLFYLFPKIVPSNVEDYRLIAEGKEPLEPKPIGWPALLYLPYQLFHNWNLVSQVFSTIFLMTALIFFKKIVKEDRLVWLLLSYPYFLFYSFVGLEQTFFITIVLMAWYFNNQLLMMASSLFRLEGTLFSLYFIFRKKRYLHILGLLFFIAIIYLTYGIEFTKQNVENWWNPVKNSLRITVILVPVALNKWKSLFKKNFRVLFTLEINAVIMYMIVKIMRFGDLVVST